MENGWAPGKELSHYVGFETNLRKLALLLSDDGSAQPGGINVRQSLALANDLLRCRAALSRGWFGCIAKASRLSGHRSTRWSSAGL